MNVAMGIPDPVVTEHAACTDRSPDLFFATPGMHHTAVKICMTCPVRLRCLAEALRAGPSLEGVWGGTSHHQRVQILRRRRAPHAAASA